MLSEETDVETASLALSAILPEARMLEKVETVPLAAGSVLIPSETEASMQIKPVHEDEVLVGDSKAVVPKLVMLMSGAVDAAAMVDCPDTDEIVVAG